MSEPNRRCPKCTEAGHDEHGDHLFLMSDGNRWTCRRVEHHEDGEVYYEGGSGDKGDSSSTDFEGPDGDKPVSTDEMFKLLGIESPDDIALPESYASSGGCIAVTEAYRGILPETFRKYKTQCKMTGGIITSFEHELKDIDGRRVVDKIRKLPKDFFTSGKTKGVALQLFGMDIYPKAKRLLIVEGEFDCMSARQMLDKYKVAVWSLPLGANMKPLMDNLDKISAFTKGHKELFFCMDPDEAGQKVLKGCASLFPTAKIVKLDRKDPNEYIDPSYPDGPDPNAFVSAFWEAEIYKPPSIIRVTSLIKDVLKRPVMGRPWPWETMTKATYGRRGGEGIYVGAGVKIGKSEFINQLLAHDCKNGWPISCCKFEEQPSMTVKRVAGKLDSIMYHKPDVIYKDEDLERTALSLEPNLFLHQAFGQARWDSVKEFIRYSVYMGCKTVIIDPITKITNGMTPSETETELRRFSDELACMAQDMDFFYIVTCHLKAPMSGLPHERGGAVQSNQFRGSRAMMENTYYQMGIERNKDPDLSEEERSTSTFVGLEDRAFGNSFKFPVFYNSTTQSYLEPTLSKSF